MGWSTAQTGFFVVAYAAAEVAHAFLAPTWRRLRTGDVGAQPFCAIAESSVALAGHDLSLAHFGPGPVPSTPTIRLERRRRMMRHAKRIAVLVLALVGSFMVACAAKKPITPRHQREKTVTITPGTCAVGKLSVSLSKSAGEYVTWKLEGSGTDKHEVRFDKPEGNPCDGGSNSLDMQVGGDKTTACTVQNAHYGTYNYSIYKTVGGNSTKCADPSVVVDN
jgi:hypothetical protein